MAEMDPLAALPAPSSQTYESTAMSLTERALSLKEALAPAAPPAPKPLRPSKERLPVATAVDPAQVLPAAQAPAAAVGPKEAEDEKAKAPAPQAPTVHENFDGGKDTNVSIPPDTAGAVGPNHVFNPLNNEIFVFDRVGALQQNVTLDAFWNAFHPNVSTFDPRAVFDPFEGRFYFATMANFGEPSSSLLVAVSDTDDPTGLWHTLRIQVDDSTQGKVWLDYPTLGFSNDKITIQVNTFLRSGNKFTGSTVYVFDKASFLNPPHTPAVATFVLPNQGGTQVPATTYDAALSEQYLVSRWSNDINGRGALAIFKVSGSVAGGTAAIARLGFVVGSRAWQSFSPADFAPQNGTTRRLDCGDDRILSVVFRNNSLWCSHSIYVPAAGPNRTGAQWWQISAPALGLLQEGLVEDPAGANFYACPTLSVNQHDDVVMGMSRFSATTFGSCAFAHRRSADTAGTMQGPAVFHGGTDSYVKTFTGAANRWGDYSATQVDPDGVSFWTVQEYADSPPNTWATRWVRITV